MVMMKACLAFIIIVILSSSTVHAETSTNNDSSLVRNNSVTNIVNEKDFVLIDTSSYEIAKNDGNFDDLGDVRALVLPVACPDELTSRMLVPQAMYTIRPSLSLDGGVRIWTHPAHLVTIAVVADGYPDDLHLLWNTTTVSKIASSLMNNVENNTSEAVGIIIEMPAWQLRTVSAGRNSTVHIHGGFTNLGYISTSGNSSMYANLTSLPVANQPAGSTLVIDVSGGSKATVIMGDAAAATAGVALEDLDNVSLDSLTTVDVSAHKSHLNIQGYVHSAALFESTLQVEGPILTSLLCGDMMGPIYKFKTAALFRITLLSSPVSAVQRMWILKLQLINLHCCLWSCPEVIQRNVVILQQAVIQRAISIL